MKYYFPHILLFCVFLAALFPVLDHYRRRHPHPRFRPGAGELTLLFVLAVAVGGPACYIVGNMFRRDVNMKDLNKKPDEGTELYKTTYQKDPDKDDDRRRKSKDD